MIRNLGGSSTRYLFKAYVLWLFLDSKVKVKFHYQRGLLTLAVLIRCAHFAQVEVVFVAKFLHFRGLQEAPLEGCIVELGVWLGFKEHVLVCSFIMRNLHIVHLSELFPFLKHHMG